MPFFFFLFFLLMVVYAVLIAYYHSAWNRLPEFVLPEKQASVFISVIIAARNEENLGARAILQGQRARLHQGKKRRMARTDAEQTFCARDNRFVGLGLEEPFFRSHNFH